MKTDVVIRRATFSDLTDVHALLTAQHLPLEGIPETLDHFVVASDGSSLIGVAGLELADCEAALLRSVAVGDSYRSLGIGTRMVDTVLANARASHIHTIYLLTTTAREYFGRRGFAVIPRDAVPEPLLNTAEFRGACPASATVMVLNLETAPH